MENVELALHSPITANNGDRVETLYLRPITAGDLEKWEKYNGSNTSRGIAMVTDLTGLHRDDVRLLDARDFTAVQEEIVRLMGKDPDQLGG